MKIFSFLSLAAALFFISCSKGPDSAAGSAMPAETLFSQKVGEVKFKAKIALTENEKMHGLMGVKALPENEGMIFVNESPHQASFWMKNTLIPLDIAFVDPEGRVLQISQMYPHSEVSVRSVSDNVLYCIEMNQGWFSKNGIKSGDKLDMELLLKGINSRVKSNG